MRKADNYAGRSTSSTEDPRYSTGRVATAFKIRNRFSRRFTQMMRVTGVNGFQMTFLWFSSQVHSWKSNA